jgi:hypothetical protein
MADAYHYEDNWPVHCLAMLENVGREFKPLLKTFGRPLAKELDIAMIPGVSGIVITEWTYRFPDKPKYVVCFGSIGLGVPGGWILVRKPDNEVFLDEPRMLAEAIGNGIGGIGGAQMFIGACAYAVQELFRKRREQLDDLEQGCLLRRMSEAADHSRWSDTKKFIDGLVR